MILLVYGTRPEFIKIKPLINTMVKEKIPFKTLFTGQHKDIVSDKANFSIEMKNFSDNRLDNIIQNCLNIPENFFEGVTHILVQGDTTSTVGLSLSAIHRKIKIIHLEAGLRSYDTENPYPEEYNRKIISTLSDINLCPTNINKENLLREGINEEKCFVVGNTGLDNLLEYKQKCEYTKTILITLHRRENHEIINEWFHEINELAKKHINLKFILPLHPNPNVRKHKEILTNVNVINPLSHDELLNILIKTKLVISDSGGIQEECSFFNKKCLVCRKVTERPEALGLSSFIIPTPNILNEMFNKHINDYSIDIESPFGDGNSSTKICEILKTIL